MYMHAAHSVSKRERGLHANHMHARMHTYIHTQYILLMCLFQMNGRADVVNFLLDNGADVNRVNNRGMSILNACHHAFFCHHPRVTRQGGEGMGVRGEGRG